MLFPFLTKEKPQHRLKNVAVAKDMLSSLPASASGALKEIASILEDFSVAQGYRPQLRADICTLVDDVGAPVLARAMNEYRFGEQAFRNAPVAEAISAYLDALLEAVGSVFSSIKLNPGAVKKEHIGALSLRAIYAFGALAKTCYFRYRAPGQKHWKVFCDAILAAEASQLAQLLISVRNMRASTVYREAGHVLMLCVSPVQELIGHEIEWADRVIGHLSNSFVMRSSKSPELDFMIDLGTGAAPVRSPEECIQDGGKRYFGPGLAIRKMEELYVHTQAGQGVPPSLSDERYSMSLDDFQSLLNLLGVSWESPSICAAARMHTASGRIGLIHGFDDCMRAIATSPAWRKRFCENMGSGAPLAYEEYMDTKLHGQIRAETKELLIARSRAQELQQADTESMVEHWEITETSESVYALDLVRGRDAWVTVDALVALRHEGNNDWELGMVRRVSRPAPGSLTIHVEVWSKLPVPIRIRTQQSSRPDESVPPDSEFRYFDGLLLPEESPFTPTLILQSAAYRQSESCVVFYMGTEIPIQTTGCVELGDRFVRATFAHKESTPSPAEAVTS